MRARSANTFTIDDLREIARTCDEHGMKSYLTVNTIIYDKDIPLMHTIVDAAKEAGISAVIAADVAVMNYARQIGQEGFRLCLIQRIKLLDDLRVFQFDDFAGEVVQGVLFRNIEEADPRGAQCLRFCPDRKSTRLNYSHSDRSRVPSSA